MKGSVKEPNMFHNYETEKSTRKASDAAENLQLYRVVRFFRPRSSCTTHFYRPLRDGWLSWPCWLTDSGRLNHIVARPASSLAQDRESSPAETSVLTTMLRRQLIFVFVLSPALHDIFHTAMA